MTVRWSYGVVGWPTTYHCVNCVIKFTTFPICTSGITTFGHSDTLTIQLKFMCVGLEIYLQGDVKKKKSSSLTFKPFENSGQFYAKHRVSARFEGTHSAQPCGQTGFLYSSSSSHSQARCDYYRGVGQYQINNMIYSALLIGQNWTFGAHLRALHPIVSSGLCPLTAEIHHDVSDYSYYNYTHTHEARDNNKNTSR